MALAFSVAALLLAALALANSVAPRSPFTYGSSRRVAEDMTLMLHASRSFYLHGGEVVEYQDVPPGERLIRIGYGHRPDKLVFWPQDLGMKSP